MSITLYGIKNCNTMKKAFDHLTQLNLAYEFHDYKKQPIDEATIKTWVVHQGIDKVLNKKGLTWRNLTDNEKAKANDDMSFAIKLMVVKPSLIKRPILTINDRVVVGYQEEIYNRLIQNQ